MGWGNCGNDSQGRPIGYEHKATCDHPGCDKAIDRGLSYACGGMHGETEYGCEKYFCEKHRSVWVQSDDERTVAVCSDCGKTLLNSGDWKECDGEAVLKRIN